MTKYFVIGGVVLLAVLLGVGAMSNDWCGFGAAVPPIAKFPIDDSAAVSTELTIASQDANNTITVKPGEQVDVGGKLTFDTTQLQWGSRNIQVLTVNAKPDNRPKAAMRLHVVRRSSFGEGEKEESVSEGGTRATGKDEVEWWGGFTAPHRQGSYRVRVYFCGYIPGKFPRKMEFERLIAETDLEVH